MSVCIHFEGEQKEDGGGFHTLNDVTKATNTELDIHLLCFVWTFFADLGNPCNRRVRGHDGQGEAAALVQAVN